jgi:hypothetical protein
MYLTISGGYRGGVHPFPFRTRKLSSPAPKILDEQLSGKIGHRQIKLKKPLLSTECSGFLFVLDGKILVRRAFVQAEQIETIEAAQYRATVGKNQGLGSTPGEALSNLLGHLGDVVPTPIVIWPYNRGDKYWSEAQQQRLLDLRSRMETLTVAEREEWEILVEMSFDATVARTQAVQSSNR